MGYRLSKIYTRTGDDGQTGLADGRRVNKSHPRIEAIGALDEFNSQLGLLLAELQEQVTTAPKLQEVLDILAPCQHRIFDMGGELAMPEYQALHANEITRIEETIDAWNVLVGPLKEFILPGGSRLIAQTHVCRSSARNAERRCQALHSSEALRAEMLGYINRLSDLLFVAGRLVALYQGCPEIYWQAADKPQ
ncbi:MAG: cob(I)yrinic acid a,c-diamide adenosyltransferase [Gammaproteobacteria bacterium]|nr:cob(I)yrinic acid a,c-diamide adenosyltransferase [Gammaproteobacteria bacterium]